MPANSVIQFRRGTAAQWTSVNPVLALAEPGYETDTGKEKRGDGSTAWNSLPYFTPGAGSNGYIDVTAAPYSADKTGATDSSTAFKAAAAAANGRWIYAPAGTYLVNSVSTSNNIRVLGSSFRLYGDGPGLTKFVFPSGPGVAMFSIKGSTGTAVATTADVAAEALTATVGSTSTFVAGGYVLLKSSKAWPGTTASSTYGEIMRVKSLTSTVITFTTPTSDAYAVADTTQVTPISMVDGVEFRDFSIENSFPSSATGSGGGGTGIEVQWARGLRISNVAFRGLDNAGILPRGCVDWRVTRTHFERMTDDPTNLFKGYGVNAFNGSRDGVVSDCTMAGGRHLFTTGDDGTVGPPRNILIADCIVTGNSNVAFDTHPEATDIVFSSCVVHQNNGPGFQTRSPRTSFIECDVDQCVGVGITFGSSATIGSRVQGGMIRRVRAGTISGPVTYTGQGIRIENNNPSHYIDGVTVIDCDDAGVSILGTTVGAQTFRNLTVDSPGKVSSGAGINFTNDSSGHIFDGQTTIKNAAYAVQGASTVTGVLVRDLKTVATPVTANGGIVYSTRPILAVTSATATMSATTAETALFTYTIPANTVNVGTVYRLFASGSTDNIATSGTLTIRIRIGGVTGTPVFAITLSSVASAKTLQAWFVDQQLTFRTTASTTTQLASGGTVYAIGNFFGNPSNGSTWDMTVNQDLVLTFQWATSDPGNLVRLQQATLDLVRA